MGVCKSWSNQICRLQGLFTDIAFDTRYDTTIFTAAKFLGIVESQSTNLHVYARCRVWIPNRAQEAFLSRLRLHSWRFVCFEVESTKCVPFIAHFNPPAPRLLRLVHTSVVPEGIFSTSFANLRVLDVSVEKYFPWTIPSFRNLVTLRLKNSRPTRRFCSTSLFDLIGRSSCLEEVRLSEFRRFSGSPKRPVIHANVKLVGFFQCNLEFLFQYLQFPSATAFRVESCGVGPTGQSGLPSSGGYFLPLEAHPIPILERYFFTKVTAHTQDLLSGDVHLKIGLECKEGLTADFEIALRKEDSWEDYLHSSINGLLQRIRLDPGVDLSISHHVPLCSTNLPLTHWREEPLSSISTPLLRLSQVVVLRTGCSLLRSVMLRLTDLENTILPNLKCYLLDVKTLPTPEYPALYESVTCLRSRFMNGSPFAIQYLTFEGETPSAKRRIHHPLTLDRLQVPIQQVPPQY